LSQLKKVFLSGQHVNSICVEIGIGYLVTKQKRRENYMESWLGISSIVWLGINTIVEIIITITIMIFVYSYLRFRLFKK
jgi:hypothetical protein